MRNAWTASLLFVVMIAVASCAGHAGREFVRPPADTLILGETSFSDIIARLGNPEKRGSAINNDVPITTINYVYSVADSGGANSRAMSFHFTDDVLVGYSFLSSFDSDNTNFNEHRLPHLEKGKTTRDEVIKIFGPPHGMQVHPLMKGPEETGLIYMYQEIRGSIFSPKVSQKILVVTLDGSDLVSDVEFSSSGP